MTLIVENGTGLPDADAYVDLEYVNTYNSNFIGDTTWTAAEDSSREIAIRQATQALDGMYHLQWSGTKKESDQTLDWPRSGVYDTDGHYVESALVPGEVEKATAELAIKALSETLVPDLDQTGTIKEIKSKLGEIEEQIKFTAGELVKDYRLVAMLVTPLLENGGSSAVVRLARS